jgi:polysaccharide export outer membrane protein
LFRKAVLEASIGTTMMTVVTAAAVAGGFTYRAVEGYAAIVRSIEGKAVEGRASRQAFVQPGDVITMFERRF